MDGSRRIVRLPTVTASLCQHDLHAVVVHIVVDGARSVRAASDTGDQIVRIVAADLFLQLPLDLLRDHTLHTGHEVGVGMRPHRRPHDIESVRGMTAPVADGLRASITQCHVTCTYGVHLSAQHLHALHVCVLTLHIRGTHKHFALHIHQRTHRCRSHTVLSGTRLGDDTRLTHLLRQQNLADGVVDLVGTRMVQVLTLQIQLTAVLLTHPLGIIQRRRSAHIVLQQRMILSLKLCALDNRQISLLQVMHTFVENLRHIRAPELSIETIFVNLILAHIFFFYSIFIVISISGY